MNNRKSATIFAFIIVFLSVYQCSSLTSLLISFVVWNFYKNERKKIVNSWRETKASFEPLLLWWVWPLELPVYSSDTDHVFTTLTPEYDENMSRTQLPQNSDNIFCFCLIKRHNNSQASRSGKHQIVSILSLYKCCMRMMVSSSVKYLRVHFFSIHV